MDTTPKAQQAPNATEQPKKGAEWKVVTAPRLIPQYEAGEYAGQWETVISNGKETKEFYGETSASSLSHANRSIEQRNK